MKSLQRIIHPLLLLAFFVPILQTASGQVPASWKTFTDTAGNFTARYPGNWINKIKEGNRVFFTSPEDRSGDRFRENVNIHVSKNPAYGVTVKIRDMFPAVLEQLKPSFKDFASEGQRYFTWNGQEACEIEYTGYNKLDETLRVRLLQWFCFFRGRLYTATFTSEANNISHTKTARNIMKSIIFK
ncbi:MAG: hypothetical protein ACO25B_13775 [Chitinophagaceae bacterium]